MANQQSNQNLPKSIEGLSDVEFIAYADYLSSPYYRSYLQAKNASNMMTRVEPRGAMSRGPAAVPEAGYRRRKGFLALVVIFMAVILAVGVLGYLGNIVPEYISAFVKPGAEATHIGITDPVLGGLTKFAKMDFDSVFYTDCLENIPGDASILTKIAYYGLPIATALALLLALIILIVALVALLKKGVSKGYVARKCRFGFLSLLLFILSLVIAACGIIWNGEFSDALNFITQKSLVVYAGYGLYAIIGASLLSMVFNWLSYKRAK